MNAGVPSLHMLLGPWGELGQSQLSFSERVSTERNRFSVPNVGFACDLWSMKSQELFVPLSSNVVIFFFVLHAQSKPT